MRLYYLLLVKSRARETKIEDFNNPFFKSIGHVSLPLLYVRGTKSVRGLFFVSLARETKKRVVKIFDKGCGFT